MTKSLTKFATATFVALGLSLFAESSVDAHWNYSNQLSYFSQAQSQILFHGALQSKVAAFWGHTTNNTMGASTMQLWVLSYCVPADPNASPYYVSGGPATGFGFAVNASCQFGDAALFGWGGISEP